MAVKTQNKTTVKDSVEQNETKSEQIETVAENKSTPTPESTPARKKAIQIDRNEMIPCRSVTEGKLTYISSRTGATYIWNSFGITEYLEFGELLSMRASLPKFLNKPWIIVDDEEAVEAISGLKELYQKISGIKDLENLEEFFQKPVSEIEKILNKLPVSTQGMIASKARDMLAKGTLYDTRIVSIIDKVMNTGLKDFIN